MDEPVTLLRAAGNVVTSILIDLARVQEVFMKVVDKFQDVALHRTGDRDVVN